MQFVMQIELSVSAFVHAIICLGADGFDSPTLREISRKRCPSMEELPRESCPSLEELPRESCPSLEEFLLEKRL